MQKAHTPVSLPPGAASWTLNSVQKILAQDPTATSLVRSRPLLPLQLACIPQNRKQSPSPSNLRHYLSFCLTSFNPIRSRKMQQRRIWSDLSTSLLPTFQKVLGCALDCIYNWGSSPLPCYPKRTTTVLCLSPPASFPIRQYIGNTATSIPAASQTIQFSKKEFYSFISPT